MMKYFVSALCIVTIVIFGCTELRWFHVEEVFTHPQWRTIQRVPMNYGIYYYLRDEYDALEQRPPFELQPCADFWEA